MNNLNAIVFYKSKIPQKPRNYIDKRESFFKITIK